MTCIMYISHFWIFWGALVSSHAVDRWSAKCTEKTIIASLRSEVLLPCHFSNNETDTVKWSHYSNGDAFLNIMNNGSIYFDGTKGRVSVFPLLFKDGIFSILIHDLEPSDIGPYFCELMGECWRVEIKESDPPIEKHDDPNPWFYFAAGAGLLILLVIGVCLFSEYCGKHTSRSSKSNPVYEGQSEGNKPPVETQTTESSGQRNKNNNRGLRRGFTTVYENDVHAPNQRSGVQQGQHPQRAFRPVPEPTASHPSNVMPYYVNQAELSVPGNAGKKRRNKKADLQFNNPIYGD